MKKLHDLSKYKLNEETLLKLQGGSNDESAKINESIMQAAKETEDVRATQLTELAEFEEYAEESLSSHLDDDDLDLLP